MQQYRGIGLMSGTSMDGLDMACCDFFEENGRYRFEVVAAETAPFDERWKNRLKKLPSQQAEVYAKTHVYFGHWMGEQTRGFMERHSLLPDFVASHGQTIFHQPSKNFTAQIGDGETMAAVLGCPVVTNFRNKNVAAGGEGAPLVPFGEQHLFPGYQLFLNLGGIANITWGGSAFDVCPCNMVLNRVVQAYQEEMAYDRGGELAAAGEVSPDLLSAFDALRYYQQRPPKSLGAEWVDQHFMPILVAHQPEPQQALRTMVEHIATQIALAAQRMGIRDQQMLVTGGGYHNTFLMERIQSHLTPLGITVDREATPAIVDFKEAIIFAFLGLAALMGMPNTLAKATGTKVPILGGAIHLPPGGWKQLL